jgi:hypothetical protein
MEVVLVGENRSNVVVSSEEGDEDMAARRVKGLSKQIEKLERKEREKRKKVPQNLLTGSERETQRRPLERGRRRACPCGASSTSSSLNIRLSKGEKSMSSCLN